MNNNKVVALIRLLLYAKNEAQFIGCEEVAMLLDLPLLSACQQVDITDVDECLHQDAEVLRNLIREAMAKKARNN
jgi:hypothetical protein